MFRRRKYRIWVQQTIAYMLSQLPLWLSPCKFNMESLSGGGLLGRSRFPIHSYCSIKSISCETVMIMSIITTTRPYMQAMP